MGLPFKRQRFSHLAHAVESLERRGSLDNADQNSHIHGSRLLQARQDAVAGPLAIPTDVTAGISTLITSIGGDQTTLESLPTIIIVSNTAPISVPISLPTDPPAPPPVPTVESLPVLPTVPSVPPFPVSLTVPAVPPFPTSLTVPAVPPFPDTHSASVSLTSSLISLGLPSITTDATDKSSPTDNPTSDHGSHTFSGPRSSYRPYSRPTRPRV